MNPNIKHFVTVPRDDFRPAYPSVSGGYATHTVHAETQSHADRSFQQRRYSVSATLGTSFFAVEGVPEAVEQGTREALNHIGAILYRDSIIKLDELRAAFFSQDMNQMGKLISELYKTFEWTDGFVRSELDIVESIRRKE